MWMDSARPGIYSVPRQWGPLQNPPILWDIESDPVLAGVKLIAEPGMPPDCQGSFISDGWKEWNGKFRMTFEFLGERDSVPFCYAADRSRMFMVTRKENLE
jgi:pullulanase/glycogen debranching enzyme